MQDEDFLSEDEPLVTAGSVKKRPVCESMECECKKRGIRGLDAHWVSDSDTGKTMSLCALAVASTSKVLPCSFCNRWMFGQCFDFNVFENYCGHCEGDVVFDQAFADVFDTDCKKLVAFQAVFLKEFVDEYPEETKPHRHAQCGMTHVLTPAGDAPQVTFTTSEERGETFWKAYEALHCDGGGSFADVETKRHAFHIMKQMPARFLEILQEREAARQKEKLERANLRRVAVQSFQENRKRVLRAFSPIANKLSDEAFDTLLPTKFARITTEAERAELDAIDAIPHPDLADEASVLAFVKHYLV